jgi:hypothetical protein
MKSIKAVVSSLVIWWPAALVTVVTGGIGWFFSLVDDLSRALLFIARHALTVSCEPACSPSMEMTDLGTALAFVAFLLLIGSLAGVTQSFMMEGKRAGMVEAAIMKRYSREAGAAYRYAVSSGVKLIESDVKYSIRILSDLTVETVFERTITAVDGPVEVMGWFTSGGPPVGTKIPQDHFSVKVIEGASEVLTVPYDRGNHQERLFVLFFYPVLMPNQPGVRLQLKSRWPLSAPALGKIDARDVNIYRVHPRVAQAVNRVEMSLRVEVPGVFEFEKEIHSGSLGCAPDWQFDERGCRLVATDVKGGTKLALEVTKTADTRS